MLDETDRREIASIMREVIKEDVTPQITSLREVVEDDIKPQLSSLRDSIEDDIKPHIISLRLTVENDIKTKLDLILERQQTIIDKLVPVSRIEELENEMKLQKIVVRQLSEDVQQLKKAQ